MDPLENVYPHKQQLGGRWQFTDSARSWKTRNHDRRHGGGCTTLIAGVEAVRKGLAKPIGSLTQMGTIRLGKRTDAQQPADQGFRPAGRAGRPGALPAGTSSATTCTRRRRPRRCWIGTSSKPIRPFLEAIKPMPAVFDQYYVKRLNGTTDQRRARTSATWPSQLRADIAGLQEETDRQVMIWCGSTEIFLKPAAVHQSLAAFEKGLEENDINIAPSHDLRLRRAEGRRPVCQRRAESDGGSAGDAGAVAQG